MTRSGNYTALFAEHEVILAQGKKSIRLKTGTNPSNRLEGLDLADGKTNYLLGRDRTTGKPTFPNIIGSATAMSTLESTSFFTAKNPSSNTTSSLARA